MNCRSFFVAVVGLWIGLAYAAAAAEKYQVYLSPMPFNDATQPFMTGAKGTATATLDGDTLSISGTFTGLSARATKARLSLSRGPGVPGDAQFDLTLDGDMAVAARLSDMFGGESPY